MSTALCLLDKGQDGVSSSSYSATFAERIAELEKRDFERSQRRLERLEKASRKALTLSCQRDNISRNYALKNRTYYNRSAVALEVNVARWVLSIGKKYSPASVVSIADTVGYTPMVLSAIERKAKEHVAEFTITMPRVTGEDLVVARRRFASAWNEFNKRVLKEKFSELFGDFVRVFEAHKDGILHAHIIIECKRSLKRGSLAFKWKSNGNVDGSTVADWVCDVWRQFRNGEFSRYGIGERHTLQPIRKGVKCFSKYVAKYITKGLGSRPLYMRGLRTVSYSRGFLSGMRLLAYDYDKSERVVYWSKASNAWKWRYRRYVAFDIECASRKVRQMKISAICRALHLSFAELKKRLGCKWGFMTRNLISSWGVGVQFGINGSDFKKLSKWEKFAFVRNWLGDAYKAVIQFSDNGEIYQYDDISDETNDETAVNEEISEVKKSTAKKAFKTKIQKRKLSTKRLTDSEREFEKEKIDVQEYLDSIPDENISEKLEAIGSIEDEDLLSDEILQYAAENGEVWAGELLTSRIQEREESSLKKEGVSLLDAVKSERFKLPTPRSIIEHFKKRGESVRGSLFGEINDLYNSLNFYQQQKYFTGKYSDIDDFANILNSEYGFNYDGAADFLDDLAQNIWGRSETRFSFADNEEFDDKDPEFLRQVEEVKAKWTNPDGTKKKGYHRAPNGKPSKLTEAQWLAVRTPNFKRWFGDWETLAIIKEIEKLPALELKKATSDYSTATKVKALFDSFGVAENSRNGQSVIFAKGSVGKIIGHKSDVPISEVLDSFKDLFESSVLAIEEKEVLKEGHKEHTNFKGYEHYVNKFNYNEKPYYIRFTVQVENAKPQTIKKGYVPRKVHSSMITDVSIYKENSQSSTDLSTSGTKGVPIFDSKLADFLNSVNEKDVSKVIDENGEPLVVYHGTRHTKEFNEFKGTQHFFSDNKDVADGFLNGYDYVLEINGDSYPMSRRDLEFLADDIMGDSAEYDSLVGEYEAGEMSYANTLLSDITHNEYTEDAIVDFPFAIRKGGRIVEAFLNIKNPVEKDYGGKTWQAGKVMPEQDLWENREADGLIGRNIREGGLTGELRNGEDFPLSTDYIVRNSNQIKSATDNIGTYSDSPDIRYSIGDLRSPEELDAINKQFADLYEQYKNGNQEAYEKAVQLVAEEAKRKGYKDKAEGRHLWINGGAPTANFEADEADYSTSIWQYAIDGRDPINFEWLTSDKNLQYNLYQNNQSEIESITAFRKAVEEAKKSNGKKDVFVYAYRAVPNEVKDSKLRNGDWITLSPTYAKHHARMNGFKRPNIIKEKVNIKYIWNDSGDSINEFGYDDGNSYAYKNTKNNRKLQDPFTFDDNGNLIPLTERFDSSNPDMRFSIVSTGGNLDVIDPVRGLSLAELYKKALKLHKQDFDGDLLYKDKKNMIFAQTGWEYDEKADRWQYDLWEGEIKIPNGFKRNWKGKISDFFPDTTLFEVYPQLKDMPVIVKPLKAVGMYLDGKIYLSNDYALAPEKFKDEIHNTLIHEVQHAIQHIENMAVGGNPTNIRTILQAYQLVSHILYGTSRVILTQKEKDSLSEFLRIVKNAYGDIVNELYGQNVSQLGKIAKKIYYALKGEREANNAGYRAKSKYNREKPISTTEDYALDDSSHYLDSIYIDEKNADLLIEYGNAALKISYDAQELANLRYSIIEDAKYDAYRNELHKIAKLTEGEMANKIIRVGNSPDVLKLIGFEDRPVHIRGNVVWKSMFNPEKGRYISEETLGKIGEAIEKPLFIEKSSTVNDAILVHTELENNGERLAVVIHLSRKHNGYTIHKIASVYDRSETQTKRAFNESRLLYLDTERSLPILKGLKIQFHSPSEDLFVNGIVRTQEDLSQYKNSGKPNFSFTDDSSHQRKRELAVELAKKLYKRLGKDFDPTKPNAFKESTPTEDERLDIYMSDMGMLDEDVDFVCDRAQAILWKLINNAKNKNSLRNNFDALASETEKNLENSRVIEACVNDALKSFQKDLDIQAKAEKIRQREEDKKLKNVTAFTSDELEANGIDLLDAVSALISDENGSLIPDEDAINAQVDAIIEHCKNTSDGDDYDVLFEKTKLTLISALSDVADAFVYGKHVKNALKAIAKLDDAKNEKSLAENAKKIARKLSEFLAKETADFEERKKKDEKRRIEKEAREAKKAEADKAKKDEQRLKKLHAKAVQMFVKFAKSQKLPESNKLDVKRKLPARVQAYLAQIKKVILLDADAVKQRFDYLQNKKSSIGENGEELSYKERYEMSALMIFGNIKEKSLPEILSAYNELKKLIQGERDKQIERIEKLEADFEAKAQPLAGALSLAGNKESKGDDFGVGRNVSMLEHRLNKLFLNRKGLSEDRRKEIETWIKDYSTRIARASIFERRFVEEEMDWLKDVLIQHYGTPEKGFERLTKVDASLSKFASDAGRDMSIGQIINIVCALEQWQVKEAYKQLQKKMENPDSNKKDKDFEAYAYWRNLFENESAMRDVLSDADKALIVDLKNRYRERLDIINPIYERLNGLPMISNGINYMPITREGEYSLEGGNDDTIRLFPDYYTPRTISLKPLDETANVLKIFADRSATDAHFINFADLIFETKMLTGNKSLSKLLKTNLTRGERRGFDWVLRDVLRGQIKHDDTVDGKIAGMIASFTAYFGLAFNLTSAFKQPSGAPAFLLKVPIIDYFAGISELLSSGEFFKTIKEVWNSPLLKDRRDSGEINQILSDFQRAEREMKNEPNAKKVLRRFLKKYAFAPVKWADSFGFVIGGTSVYYHLLQQYKELYPESQAKALAMADMVNVGEMTQQSSLIMNMSEGQRRNGGIGKMFSTFRTTNQQYLSFELDAFAEVVANPSGKSFAKLARVLILNHAVLPTLFNGMGFLANILLGDDFDDEDLDYMLKNIAICAFFDVFTGWWVTSIFKGLAQMYFLGGYNKLTDSMLPASSVARFGEALLYAGKDIFENGMDADWWKHFDRIGKSTLAPYRLGKKIYDNATDNEEGAWW